MNRPIHFEIPVENPERAIAFYENVFGWKFQKWDGPMPYWMIITGDQGKPGINGGLMPRRDPAQPCVNTMGVMNVDEMVAKVESNGGKCVVPKIAVPTVGWLAYCKDLDGHIFGMMQDDPSAK